MTCKESIEWLKSLKKQIQYLGLWHYEQTLTEIIELLQSDRIIELPCKVSETVYCLNDIVDNELCADCEHYYEGGMGDYPSCQETRYGFRPAKCIEIIKIVADRNFILNYYNEFG